MKSLNHIPQHLLYPLSDSTKKILDHAFRSIPNASPTLSFLESKSKFLHDYDLAVLKILEYELDFLGSFVVNPSSKSLKISSSEALDISLKLIETVMSAIDFSERPISHARC
jgi:hypothetical protein